MDDPNSALPSDPTVDESYTRGSRPVQPRTRSGSCTSGNDKDPQKSATNRQKTAGNKTRPSVPTDGTGTNWPDVSPELPPVSRLPHSLAMAC